MKTKPLFMPGNEIWWDLGSSAGILCIVIEVKKEHFLYMPLSGSSIYKGNYEDMAFQKSSKERSEEFWNGLSENRAFNIREFLSKHGITIDRFPLEVA